MKIKTYSPFRKTLKSNVLNLLVALMCFGSTGVNGYNTYKYMVKNNYNDATFTVIFALLTLALAISNMYIFFKNYRRNKLNNPQL